MPKLTNDLFDESILSVRINSHDQRRFRPRLNPGDAVSRPD